MNAQKLLLDRRMNNMINVKKTKIKKYKNYDNLTIEEMINKYEKHHDTAIIHNGHVIGFSHE